MEMPTQRPRKIAPKVPTDCPPKGMWFEYRPDREDSFVARWRVPGGKKEARAFSSERERALFAADWLKRRKEFGRLAGGVSPKVVEALDEFKRITGGADLLAVAREWVKWRGVAEGRLSLNDAVAGYLAAMSVKIVGRDSTTHRDLHLRRLKDFFGDSAKLADLTSERLRVWLAALRDPETGHLMGNTTRKAHRATVNRMLEHAIAERWLTANPMQAVPVPDVDDGDDVNILTVEQARHLFAVNRGALCVGRLALEAFAGLRFTSAARLAAEDLDIEAKGVTFPAPKHKSRRRHYVDGWPENVWAWVKHAPEACWQLNARLYALHKRQCFERAGYKGEGAEDEAMRNVLRHSFATYHVAAYKDAGKTAVLLTHRNPSMLYAHYKGRASQVGGLEYFGIVP